MMTNADKMLLGTSTPLTTKVFIAKSVIFWVVTQDCENGIIRVADKRRRDSIALNCSAREIDRKALFGKNKK